MIHSILLIGQSNMAGRGFACEVDPIDTARLKILRNGRWQPMFTPVNPDRPTAGISLAESFAAAYAKEHGVDVGLIPCADGGTCLDQWQPGSLLFDHAVYQVRLAERTSTLAGILWHQGEADCRADRYPLYEEKLTRILDELQKAIGIFDVPVLLGGLGDFLPDMNEAQVRGLANYTKVNEALRRIAEHRSMTGFVSAEGLASNPDCLHFNANSLREFGLRYYEVFRTLEDRTKVFAEKCGADDAVRDTMELL